MRPTPSQMLRSVMQRMHERIVVAEASAEECLTRLELQSPGPNGREVLLEEREWIAKLEETARDGCGGWFGRHGPAGEQLASL